MTIFALGLCAPTAIPLVAATGLPAGWKDPISGALAVDLPEVKMVAATPVMSKEGFAELKRRLGGLVRRWGPTDTVGPLRYRVGLVTFAAPILRGWFGLNLHHHLPGFDSLPLRWHVGGDVIFVSSLIVFGGDFWDKLRALFSRDARSVFPSAPLNGGRACAEPLEALATLPLASLGGLWWNLAWLAKLPISRLVRRRAIGYHGTTQPSSSTHRGRDKE